MINSGKFKADEILMLNFFLSKFKLGMLMNVMFMKSMHPVLCSLLSMKKLNLVGIVDITELLLAKTDEGRLA